MSAPLSLPFVLAVRLPSRAEHWSIEPSESDAALVSRAKRGDRWAEEALYRRHARRVTRVVLRIMARAGETEDVVQDTFVVAFESLGDVLGDAGHRHVFFTGAESPRQRTQSIVEFHDDPKTSVMLLSDAGGVGLNLQRAASACINLELPWNPAVLEQRIGRIHRLGRKSPIDVYNLVTEQGIEARIAALIATKKALFGGLFDGTTDSVRFEGKASFLADIEKLVAPLPELPAFPVAEIASDADDPDVDADSLPASALDGALIDALPNNDSMGSSDVLPPAAATVPSENVPGSRPGPLSNVADLLHALSVTRAPDGTVYISAPPDTADALLALFRGVAELVAKGPATPARPRP
jgi:hypothetical protein